MSATTYERSGMNVKHNAPDGTELKVENKRWTCEGTAKGKDEDR